MGKTANLHSLICVYSWYKCGTVLSQRQCKVLDTEFTKNKPIYISTVTEAELFRFPGLTDEEAKDIDTFLETISIVPVDSHIARLAGFVGRRYAVKLADSIIAATALYTGTEVLTRNVRDFKKIKDLRVLRVWIGEDCTK